MLEKFRLAIQRRNCMSQQWRTVLKRGETSSVLTRSRLAGARSSTVAQLLSVNQPSLPFTPVMVQKGLRLKAEGLKIAMEEAIEKGIYYGISLQNNPNILIL
ncbi:hypothetical protein OSB04_001757 [Centaurea solstitialis]|uniref:Uncharacterized protein n=1 Tax=Centaurea solstitialis TaxID=347529 RepID=A0AA38WV23_9ASTR|nr:hypothetical protein OSB04_001757 [Centaurea solstitialis]